MSALHPSELALANLIHDLRQPLGNIESSVWCLRSFLSSADPRIREQVALIERQVEEAERLLAAAADELHRVRVQRAEAAVNLEVTNSAS
jgi:K+-sensing histidine kinase KdpD